MQKKTKKKNNTYRRKRKPTWIRQKYQRADEKQNDLQTHEKSPAYEKNTTCRQNKYPHAVEINMTKKGQPAYENIPNMHTKQISNCKWKKYQPAYEKIYNRHKQKTQNYLHTKHISTCRRKKHITKTHTDDEKVNRHTNKKKKSTTKKKQKKNKHTHAYDKKTTYRRKRKTTCSKTKNTHKIYAYENKEKLLMVGGTPTYEKSIHVCEQNSHVYKKKKKKKKTPAEKRKHTHTERKKN